MYILLTDTFAVADFVRCMERKDLLASRLYGVVIVEEEVPYSVASGEYLSKQWNQLNTEKQPFDLRGLLIVTSSPPSNPSYAQFQEEVAHGNRYYSRGYYGATIISLELFI